VTELVISGQYERALDIVYIRPWQQITNILEHTGTEIEL